MVVNITAEFYACRLFLTFSIRFCATFDKTDTILRELPHWLKGLYDLIHSFALMNRNYVAKFDYSPMLQIRLWNINLYFYDLLELYIRWPDDFITSPTKIREFYDMSIILVFQERWSVGQLFATTWIFLKSIVLQ